MTEFDTYGVNSVFAHGNGSEVEAIHLNGLILFRDVSAMMQEQSTECIIGILIQGELNSILVVEIIDFEAG